MIDCISAAWNDFWHIMWMVRFGFVVVGVILTLIGLIAAFVLSLAKDEWR